MLCILSLCTAVWPMYMRDCERSNIDVFKIIMLRRANVFINVGNGAACSCLHLQNVPDVLFCATTVP